MQYLP